MSRIKQVGRGVAMLAVLAGVTLGSMPLASAQSQQWGSQHGQSQWNQWDWNDDDRDDKKSDHDRGGRFGIYDDLGRCDDIEDRMDCQFGAILIYVPLMREDGKSVFPSDLRDRLRRRSRNCIVYVKVKPVLEKECGADSVIEYRHCNPDHCPGDEKFYEAMRRLWREARSLGIDRYIAWAPEANSPKKGWYVKNSNNNCPDYNMAFQMFGKAGREEGCRNKPIWSISRYHGGCADPRDMYPGDEYVGGYGGSIYYRPEWSRDSNGRWSVGWRDHISEMCDELNYFNRGRKPCFIETGVARGPWTQDCLRDMSRSCRNKSDIAAVFCNNRYEERDGGKHDNWRWDDCYDSKSAFKEMCDSFGWRD